ncbi:4Fe-4S binding protein [Neobacillus sp. OS1-2]|uniref:DUF362 domain-containing protein n=1 Tax=Neobacillus sp. OS1-2 TaxID=3070680 RepID=UPI0027E108AC|nr:4Fe-4S binding protein [Neobacillus sp. OS1-2]WML40189.1 4Fe-4S binding protein [Neobacillus sp. OS1-2]
MSLLVNWLESLHIDLKISNKCSRKRHLRSTCTTCIEECKFEALTIQEQTIKVNRERCTSCGECLISCPLSAIEGIPLSREFDKCSLIYNEDYTPSVKELLIYKKRKIHSITIAENSLNQKWESVLNEVNRKLKILGDDPICVKQKNKEQMLSRRAFFTSLKKEMKNVARNMAPAKWKLDAEEWMITNYYPDFQFFKVEIDYNKCTLCQVCFAFCSQKVFNAGDSFLRINNEKCVNCTDCRDICPEHAIQIQVDFQENSKLVENFHKKKCRACGQLFFPLSRKGKNAIFVQAGILDG